MKITSKLAGFLIIAFAVAFTGCHKKNKSGVNMGGSTGTAITGTNTGMNNANNQTVTADSSDFTATMTGQNEVPAVQTNAHGMAFFRVNNDSSKIMYTLKVQNAKNITMAHIHYAVSGKNGPIVVWLYPGPGQKNPSAKNGSTNGVLKSGSFTSSDLVGPMKGKTIKDLIHAIEHDSTYANVHNKANPKGYIRGQIKSGGMMNNNSNM
jgi:hypothetical protein